MAGKYDKLTSHLRAAAERQQSVVDLDFGTVATLVGGLPPSAMSRQWWANSSHVQAMAWRAAGYHVSSVSLDHRRVRFSVGTIGGSHHGSGGQKTAKPASEPSSTKMSVATWTPVGEQIDVRVVLQWRGAGTVELDKLGKPTFVALPASPGLYRLTLTGAPGQKRPRVYIGESDRLARRLRGNYRNPGASQQTSLRINALLREHLGSGGRVELAISIEATVYVAAEVGEPAPVVADLSRKSTRLLAENAALVLAHLTDDADIENLP